VDQESAAGILHRKGGKAMTPRSDPFRPVVTTVRELAKSRKLPRTPIVIHLTRREWTKQLRSIALSRGRTPKISPGMFVVQSPFGDYLGFLVCRGPGCIPRLTHTRMGIAMNGCICSRPGRRPPELIAVHGCSAVISALGRVIACRGECSETKKTCTLRRWPATINGVKGELVLCACE